MKPDRSFHTNSSYIMRHDPTGPEDVDVMDREYCSDCKRVGCVCKEEWEDES